MSFKKQEKIHRVQDHSTRYSESRPPFSKGEVTSDFIYRLS